MLPFVMREPSLLMLVALVPAPLHGYGILQEVAELSGGRVRLRPGTLYAALDRMVGDGWIEAAGEHVVDGRLRRDYRLTALGAGVLDREVEQLEANALPGPSGTGRPRRNVGRLMLERRYRRLLRLFPHDWRARYEDELLDVLLRGAAPGQRRVGLRETLDLLGAAARVRARRIGLAGWACAASVVVVAIVAVRVGAVVTPDFVVTSLIVALVPGTGVVYTVSASLGGGAARGMVAAVGCTLGIVPHIAAAMMGLSGAMQAGAAAFEVVRWAGVAYLAVMGIAMIRGSGGMRFVPEPDGSDDLRRLRRGIVLNLLNPKLTVFFFAFLPQFLHDDPGVLDPRMAELGAVFMVVTLVVFAGYALAGSAARERILASPGVLRRVEQTLGALLLGFAARLAASDR